MGSGCGEAPVDSGLAIRHVLLGHSLPAFSVDIHDSGEVVTTTPARLLALAERLDFYARHLLPGDFRREQFETIARELREAAGEDANDPVLAERARIVAHLRARADNIGSELHNWHAFVLREEANNIESGTDEQTTPEQYEEKTDVYAEAAGEADDDIEERSGK
jgi:hypothetical protein